MTRACRCWVISSDALRPSLTCQRAGSINARLIAAAPDLLAALKEIVRGDQPHGVYSGSQCVEIAQAAIAKAEAQMKMRQHYELASHLRTDHIHPSQRLVFARLSIWRRFMRWIGK
jgi:hypothetical protein